MPEDHIFLETCYPYRPEAYETLGGQIWQLSKRTGVEFSLHDARRWVNTALEQIAISENWPRKIRGRKVRGEESPYSRPAIEQLRAKFREAVPLLQFTIEPLIPKEVEERLAALEAEKTEIKKKYRIYRQKSRKSKPKTTGDDDCKDVEHCQRIVEENELPELLTAG